MNSRLSFICIISIVLLLVITVAMPQNSSDGIGFPEAEENEYLKNKDGREPIFAPSMCQENELYYPGDQVDDWICDCRPAHIFHPGSDKCWPAWRRGPCNESEYLIMIPNSVVPVCRRNPCVNDSYVPWSGRCVKLGTPGLCAHLFPTAATLDVNSTTLQVDCVKLSLEVRFRDAPSKGCSLGSKRSVDNKCKQSQPNAI